MAATGHGALWLPVPACTLLTLAWSRNLASLAADTICISNPRGGNYTLAPSSTYTAVTGATTTA